jgi:hypothetical protein
MDNRKFEVRLPDGARDFSLLHFMVWSIQWILINPIYYDHVGPLLSVSDLTFTQSLKVARAYF